MAKRTNKTKRTKPSSDPNVAAYEAVAKLTGQARLKKPPRKRRPK